METWGLVEPFEVDNGELASFSPALCFALGVEWELFRQRLATGERFTQLVMTEGASRLVRMTERQNRFVEHHSHCDGWTEIIVGDYSV
jgi:hypothetical protein